MELINLYIYKTPLFLAIEKENIEVIKLISLNNKLDVNLGYKIIFYYYQMKLYHMFLIKHQFFWQLKKEILKLLRFYYKIKNLMLIVEMFHNCILIKFIIKIK